MNIDDVQKSIVSCKINERRLEDEVGESKPCQGTAFVVKYKLWGWRRLLLVSVVFLLFLSWILVFNDPLAPELVLQRLSGPDVPLSLFGLVWLELELDCVRAFRMPQTD